MSKKKYSYKDWWDGIVCLAYSETVHAKYDVKQIRCIWDDFADEDVIKIKNKQKEIFNDSYNDLLNKWIKIFSNGFEKSKFKKKYLKNEIDDFNRILFDKNCILIKNNFNE